MRFFRNIRSKIWAGVSVALLSYLFATLAITWVNNQTKASISHVEKTDLPLSFMGIRVQALFNAQSDDYENGLLSGEEARVRQANGRHEEISVLLDELVRLTSRRHTDIYPRVLALRDEYNDYFDMASQSYLEAVRRGDISAPGRKVRQLGTLRARLDADFKHVVQVLQKMIVGDLTANNERIDRYTRLLQVLCVLFLVVTTVVINWLANKEIISPLTRVKKMILDFSRGRTVDKPAASHAGDEINDLAVSFWQMSRELQHITVSRDYVDNIINNMSDSLIILDPDLTIQMVNHATLRLLRLSEEELEGTAFSAVFSHPDTSVASSLFQGLLEGKAVTNLEAFYVDVDKRAIPVLFSASALYLPDGTLQGISCLGHDVSELKEQRDQLDFLVNFDRLTGLPNRNLFFDRLQLTMNEARRYGHLFALLYLDVDHFKPLNDTYGHEGADLALQEVGRRLTATVRETDTVSRVGSDEFAVLLSRVHNASDAMKVATKILEAVGKPFYIHEHECVLGVSIGICLSSPELTSADVLVKNADTAMYAAKAEGRNRFIFSVPD